MKYIKLFSNSATLVLCIVFLSLLIVLFRMQFFDRDYYKTIAEKNFVRIKRIPPVRGEIFDRQYTPVVLNESSKNLYFVPGKLKNKKKLSEFISGRFDMTTDEVLDIIYKNRFRSYQEIPLVVNMEYEDFIYVSENMNFYPSLVFKTEYKRNYLYGSHFTGYVGRISDTQYENIDKKEYTINDVIGKNGIEKQYEELLRGTSGYNIIQVDAKGRSLGLLKHNLSRPVEHGYQIILTIDNYVQNYIQGIVKDYNASVIVMNAETGEVIAYVNNPVYDPNIFMGRISQKDWSELINNKDKPMLDRTIHATYPPGSVYKPVVASLALDTHVIDEYTELEPCTGGMEIGGRYFRCWNSAGHGLQNVSEAIRHSCDVFFYDLSTRLRLEDIGDFTQRNFITVKTGIDLPQERNGFFPTRKWYKDTYGPHASIIGHTVNIAIGQGEILCTPLQICAYYAALGNDGVWNQPHIFSKAIGKGAEEVNSRIKYNQKKLPMTGETLALIKKALYETVNRKGGTGHLAGHPVVKVSGKTGSAENHINDVTHAWFGGYAEWEDEKIAVAVFLENAGHGGNVAAPIMGEIVKFYDNYKKVSGE